MGMSIKVNNGKRKIRVNITVDKALLGKAKKKLDLFGGKLSTLFNVYLGDFVRTMERAPGKEREETTQRIKELEARIKKLERTSN